MNPPTATVTTPSHVATTLKTKSCMHLAIVLFPSTRTAVGGPVLYQPTMTQFSRWLAPVVAICLVAHSQSGAAQRPMSAERATLEARAARAESLTIGDSGAESTRADRLAEATAIRARLRDGDFHVGDRITVWVNGEQALSNTFTVRAGNTLQLPTLSEISLQGVLRSELRDVLTTEIKRFIKNPEVQVSTQIHIAVLGAIGKPGFYSVSPDAPLTDVLMTAGGPAANADFGRAKILRGAATFAGPTQLRSALGANRTLEDVGIQTGDQIVIGERPRRFDKVTAVAGVLSVAATTIFLVIR